MVTKCNAGQFLDDGDVAAIQQLLDTEMSMAAAFRSYVEPVNGGSFKLTAFKDHMRARCVCYRK
ncbi:hypothetical protein SEA_SCHMIDT_59 [Gordonia phage Schmidt]|uniref:Uncharacterized protein n=1 Tax=Gordonia phage Schmidt TaxID=2301697 RepID=A0A385E397_9CAUD|nr:hypothetical protein KDJ59_gp59 [Gordonia phage Schmidt]AXQ65179.1 hypothetical protein SEA_SCHMIDT_59 [Gordonia phage Schmidt]